MKLNKKHYQKNNLISIVGGGEEEDLELAINGNEDSNNLSSDSTDELEIGNQVTQTNQPINNEKNQ